MPEALFWCIGVPTPIRQNTGCSGWGVGHRHHHDAQLFCKVKKGQLNSSTISSGPDPAKPRGEITSVHAKTILPLVEEKQLTSNNGKENGRSKFPNTNLANPISLIETMANSDTKTGLAKKHVPITEDTHTVNWTHLDGKLGWINKLLGAKRLRTWIIVNTNFNMTRHLKHLEESIHF